MASVYDVAKYILDNLGSMSTWKLQKLCYYAQAWSLAWDEKPLFKEDFEAWANGPVCPELFHKHKGSFYVDSDLFADRDNYEFTTEQKETIDAVLNHYGDKDPYWLREQSHREAPWRDARGNLPDRAYCNTVITKDAMGEYYGAL